MVLREKLIILRDKAGISQMALAHQLGVSRQAVSRWESGDAIPAIDNLKALASIYDVSLDWLCNDDADDKSGKKDVLEEKQEKRSESPEIVQEAQKENKLTKRVMITITTVVAVLGILMGVITHSVMISVLVVAVAVLSLAAYLLIQLVSHIIMQSRTKKEVRREDAV